MLKVQKKKESHCQTRSFRDPRSSQTWLHRGPVANSVLLFILFTQPASFHWLTDSELSGPARPSKKHDPPAGMAASYQASVCACCHFKPGSSQIKPTDIHRSHMAPTWRWAKAGLHWCRCRDAENTARIIERACVRAFRNRTRFPPTFITNQYKSQAKKPCLATLSQADTVIITLCT